jgi:mono/diheme cytochrome c family protein
VNVNLVPHIIKLPHRHKLLFLALGSVCLLVLGITAGFVVLLSGGYSTAATKQHFAITYRILELGLRYSVGAYAEEIETPDLSRADVELGQACYRRYCAQCHGGPGITRAAIGQGQLPAPSSLVQSAREWPAAHLFYVVQKGVRMSGMPAWEFRISEHGLWSTVAFLKQMPLMTPADYGHMSGARQESDCPPPTHSVPYSAEHARSLLQQYNCPDCHRIAGVVGPRTHIGPTLVDWHSRKFIAGTLPNTPEHLVRWILDPRALSPQTLMPDVQVTEVHARTMARYLFEER